MKSYTRINYEKNENCFVKTKHVVSTLLYGNPNYIENPLFTVLIPTYKRADMLNDALNSVINQWHVSFSWDILILDNEPYDGTANDTEQLVRKINNPRILYYRNDCNLRPGDNFNRGILLARGKWVMLLHDDDILIANSLQNMGRIVGFLTRHSKRTIGAVNAMYHQFTYDPDFPRKHWQEIIPSQEYYVSLPTCFWLKKLTHWHIFFTSHIGGDVPSNGATFNRAAVLDVGGFNDDFGISADLILNYCLENKYDVYSTMVPMGFYRWGNNTMSKFESTFKTIEAGYSFREYVYSKNCFTRIWGRLFRSSQYRQFTLCVIGQRKRSIDDREIALADFDEIYAKEPNKHWYAFYSLAVGRAYEFVKVKQMKRLNEKALKDREIWQ